MFSILERHAYIYVLTYMHMDTHGQNIHTDRQTYIHFIAEGEIEWREDEKLTRLRKAMGNMAIHPLYKSY